MGKEAGAGFAQEKSIKDLRRRSGVASNTLYVKPDESVHSITTGVELEVAKLATGEDLSHVVALVASGLMFGSSGGI